ncbi:conserved exported hypothetical protein [Pseudomonas sp. OF001]|uniref:DUF2790 domain-containing protein n=1 Tax=unclassified Pseudomonas TaxID=196821 RepID=UPI00191A5720|nr:MULTISPECIES: DUF2790 domain-containing protein [unclassified Pseudomonas]WPP46122.1 DUF2790 domain-containing protein [Pseudomonas sp. AN-1]CAD5378523.1 conserved exported hypothetical protein [Pseudomonas sp. OF001]
MKSLKAILALSMFAVSSTAISAGFDNDPDKIIQENQRAMEAYAAELGKPAPKVEKYRYGMELDVVKVISVTRKAKVCGVVPARMTFLDSKGELQTVEYQAVGGGCRRG